MHRPFTKANFLTFISSLSTRTANYLSWRPLRLLLDATGYGKLGLLVMNEYLRFAYHLLSSHGSVTCVKVLKDLDSRTKLVVLGQRVERAPYGGVWIKSSPNGLPVRLKALRSCITSNPKLAVQITSLVRLIRLRPSYDTSTITSKCTVEWPPKWLDDYRSFCDKHLPQINPEFTPWHSSTKSGPNGPAAVVSSGIDAIACAMSPVTDFSFKRLCNLLGLTYLSERYTTFVDKFIRTDKVEVKWPRQITNAKLAFLSDKAGKTRVVYILNYWWQELLLPLHNAVFGWLRKQSQDGTFDQIRVVETVKSWTKEGKPLWSFDLTAATDRWPKAHQVIGINSIAGPIWSEAWMTAMGIAPYNYHAGKWEFYAVGQPMGAYASWAALALNHHALIRWCASRVGVNWNCYVVLGDDVVIADKRVAKAYLAALTDLGVTISEAKSVLAEKQITGSSAEFAKQILRDGEDLTAISPDLLKEIYEHHQWWKFLDLLVELKERFGLSVYKLSDGSLWFPTPINDLMAPLKRYRKNLIALISDPQGPRCLLTEVKEGLILADGGVKLDNPWVDVDNLTYLTYKGEMLEEKLLASLQQLMKLKDELKGVEDSGNKLSGWMVEFKEHPIWAIIDRLEGVILENQRYIATLTFPKESVMDLAMDADFLHHLLIKGVSYNEWKDQKSRKLKVACAFSLELLKKATGQDSQGTGVSYEDW